MKKKQTQPEENQTEILQEDLAELKEEIQEEEPVEKNYLEDLQRVQAEFENYMKRVEKERILLGDFAKRDLLLKILALQDEFDVALEAMKQSEDKEEILKGVEMLHQQMHKILEREQVRAIHAAGKKFDPYHHDAIMQVDGDDGVVVEEVKKGYLFKDKLLRASIVKVGKGNGNGLDKEEGEKE